MELAKQSIELIKFSAIMTVSVCTAGLAYIFYMAQPTGRVVVDFNHYGEAGIESVLIGFSLVCCLYLIFSQLNKLKELKAIK